MVYADIRTWYTALHVITAPKNTPRETQHLKLGTEKMGRPKKYRRNYYIFKFPSKVYYPEGCHIVMESNEVCKECRKPLNWKQKHQKAKYCSKKCANRANGKKRKGVKTGPKQNIMGL